MKLIAHLANVVSAERKAAEPMPDATLKTSTAAEFDVLLQTLQANAAMHPEYRADLARMLQRAVSLGSELATDAFDFDTVMMHFTKLQSVLSNLISHAHESRTRINGFGLVSGTRVLPFFALGHDEAERMRTGMQGLAVDVVGVEIIHRSGFSPRQVEPPKFPSSEPTTGVVATPAGAADSGIAHGPTGALILDPPNVVPLTPVPAPVINTGSNEVKS